MNLYQINFKKQHNGVVEAVTGMKVWQQMSYLITRWHSPANVKLMSLWCAYKGEEIRKS